MVEVGQCVAGNCSLRGFGLDVFLCGINSGINQILAGDSITICTLAFSINSEPVATGVVMINRLN